jgi:very-short-patch-repair endonuclease
VAQPLHRADECGFTANRWRSNRKLRVDDVADLARQQFGRVRYDQLLALGISETTIRRWHSGSYIRRVLPRVYAGGHQAPSAEADLAAAVLYAGPGALLSHATAAWWHDLLKYPPKTISVSTPRDVRSHSNIRVHGRRHLERIVHNGLPVTTPSQTIIDFAASGPTELLRFVLANADYNDVLCVRELSSLIGQGVAGTVALNEALKIHLPELARTRSRGERLLVSLCQNHGLPIPRVNIYVQGWLVDAHWPEHKLVVEIDGPQGHRTPAQLYSDHQRDLELRAAGYIILRYTERQLIETPAAVAADIRRYL